MSYLAPPRVAFVGADAMVNPPTANNNNTIDMVDIARVRLRNPKNLDPAAFQAWLMSPVTLKILNPDGAPGMTISSLMGLWNYYGDHAISFGGACATSVTMADGSALLPGECDDPLLGATISISARMVDVDPADNYATQIIAGTFKVIGQSPDGRPLTLIRGEQPSVACSRWISADRPLGAAIFQCVIPPERLQFDGSGRSVALEALRLATLGGQGLVLRYCLYALRTRPGVNAAYLAERFAQGAVVANPGYGMVVGTFAPWDGKGLRSAPVGRLLYRPSSPFTGAAPAVPRYHIKTHEDLAHLWQMRAHAPDDQPAPPAPPAAPASAPAERPVPPAPGPAVALVDRQRQVVLLDLLSTFPEVSPSDRTKVDYGPVSLRLSYAGPGGTEQSVTIGPVIYHQSIYETFGGVVEVPFIGRDDVTPYLGIGQLWLGRDDDGSALLREITTVQVETDDRSIYLQEGDLGWITLRVFAAGQPVQAPVKVRLELWRDYNRSEPVDETTTPPTVTSAFFGYERVRRNDPAMAIRSSITVPPGGVARLKIVPKQPGCYKIRFIPPDVTVNPDTPDFSEECYANMRVLPTDDYSGYSDEEVNRWSFMYEEVFGYYVLLYPIMSAIIPWGPWDTPGDPDRIGEFAALIRQFVDERLIDSPMYMPISRELSAGKRRLIQRWCDLQLGGSREQESPG